MSARSSPRTCSHLRPVSSPSRHCLVADHHPPKKMIHHPRPSGAGFVHLSDMLPLVVTVRRGQSSCTLPAHLLERMLRVPNLEAMLLRLVDPHAVHKGREPTESEDVLNKPGTNENGIYMYTKNPFPLKEDRGSGKEENIERDSDVDNPEQFAAYLATRLNDEKSTAWYRMVARRVDHNIIRDALVRALDIPA